MKKRIKTPKVGSKAKPKKRQASKKAGPRKLSQKISRVLAIETSCDDTSVALVRTDGFVEAVQSLNQDALHAPFGGVIPEMACRNHTMKLLPLIDEVMKKAGVNQEQIDGIAVTSRPGLVGSLMVGVTVAKSLGYLWKKPFIGVNHLEGHLHAPLLCDEKWSPPTGFDYPFVGLCVSGGHTSLYVVRGLGRYELLGHTLDDAAGEAFDKFGKVLGLGYPAGHLVDRNAAEGKRDRFEFPRAMMAKGDLRFSFSGLKTAGQLAVQQLKKQLNSDTLPESDVRDLCASYQEAIAEVLVAKLFRAVKTSKLSKAVITGGVSANSRLRQLAMDVAEENGVTLIVPPMRYCTDNAAMIGYVGAKRLQRGERSDLSLAPEAAMKISDLR